MISKKSLLSQAIFVVLGLLIINAHFIQAKNMWPELVGESAEYAKSVIQAVDPSLNVFTVPEGSIVTGDIRMNRVRLFVNTDDIVTRTPIRG